MKALTTTEGVIALLQAPAAAAPLGAPIKTESLWMPAEKPMSGYAVVGSKGHEGEELAQTGG